MSPGERLLVQHAGRSILHNIASATSIIFFYAISIFLFSFSAYRHLRRGLASWPTRVMFTTTLISFLLVTLYEVSFLAGYAMQIKGLLVDSAGTFNTAKIHRVNEHGMALSILRFWTPQLSLILGDGIVIWRAWVLYWNQRWIMLGPCILLVGTVGTSLAFLVLESTSRIALITGRPPPIIPYLFIASLALSLATNVISTSLIMYKFWVHLSFNIQMKIGRKSMSPVLRLMLILVESGFAYCLLQVLVLITDLTHTGSASRRDAFDFFWITTQMITAIYPTVIVLVVNQQRSMVETFGFNTELMRHDAADLEHISVRPQCLATSLIPQS